QVAGFSLRPEDLDAVCFWTREPRPLLPHLAELDGRGLNYYFQFTLTPYGPPVEPHLPPLKERVDALLGLAARIGPERVVWRYDPVILSGATPVDWHLAQAGALAARLSGATRRLVISFCDFYGAGKGRLGRALQGSGIEPADITAPEHAAELEQVALGFGALARRNGLEIFTCTEEADLERFGIGHGACIDGELIQRLFGGNPSRRKDRNQRQGCNCVASVDMGTYNSCPFRCAYCYANFNTGIIEQNRLRHDPESALLLGWHDGEVEIRKSLRGG
ncbi:MAG TPA: DUF1848 domain-containing protein, partial [Geomobilimonas sp.]|nr:DUF1848 domain-containing protein [Geomobilimonas sp.]